MFSCYLIDYCKKDIILSLSQKKIGNVVNVPIVDERVNDLCKKYKLRLSSTYITAFEFKNERYCKKLSENVSFLKEKYVTILTAVEKFAESHNGNTL